MRLCSAAFGNARPGKEAAVGRDARAVAGLSWAVAKAASVSG